MPNLNPFQILRIAPVLVLDMQHDGVAVDVLEAGNIRIGRGRSDAERHRQGKCQNDVGSIELGIDQFIADQRPSRRSNQVDVEALALILAHGMRQQQRRGAGDRNEADVEFGLFRLARLLRQGLAGLERKQFRDGAKSRGGADGFQECAPMQAIRNDCIQDCRFDDAIAVVFAACVIAFRLRSPERSAVYFHRALASAPTGAR